MELLSVNNTSNFIYNDLKPVFNHKKSPIVAIGLLNN